MNTQINENTLQVSYRGATIAVELTPPAGATLKINGLARDTHSGTPPCTFRLSSTVQTDYEWHEFIEAVIRYDVSGVSIAIEASSERIAEQTLPLTQTET